MDAQPKDRNAPSWRAFAAAIAAAVVLTAGLQMLILTAGAPDEATLAIVAGHMRGEISDRPADIVSRDPRTLKTWLAGRLPVAAFVADLAPAGFELLGARIDIVAGAGAPTLVYKRHERLVSVTEPPFDPGDYPRAPGRRTLNGYTVVVWADGARAFAAVSDLAPAELDAFVAAFRQAVAKETEETTSGAK
ncbi:MAG: hypothetical protein HYS06_05905 [Methylocystis sp.]|nr:hypothetical protein [Methylocystis sp.]MBI3274450.1 hypothetical protein [Methylocystis sp.]